MTQKLSNISIARYRDFLQEIGCKCNRTKGGHEHWSRSDLPRPITLQTHVEPVPEFIIRQHLRYLNMSRNDFIAVVSSKKQKKK